MFTTETLNFSTMSPDQITATLKQYKIALTIDEILKIQNEILHRPPSLTECILWSIQGSEHSSYKSSRPFLKQFITTGPNVMLGPSEDAGIVEVARDNEGHKYGIVMSHESHNHPSQIVPYEGAATGIGGNVRDVACMGAKVIANADPLRFGDINEKKTKWIHDGVVSGIAGYGNPIGVPCIAGDVYYDKSYNENCLVNVVALGVIRDDEIIHSRAPKNAQGYDLILIGKPTDNSGFGGASFASLELDENQKEQNKGAVQEPNAFLKRHLLKASYALFALLKEKKLLDKVGFKDLGAGGIACAAVELADHAHYGAEVNLDLVHTSMKNLHPGVLLCSETQERFMWVAHPDVTPLILNHYNTTFDLPNISQGAKASVVGKIRSDDQFIVTAHGEEIVHAKASDVTSGLLYQRPYSKPERNFVELNLAEPSPHCHSDDEGGISVSIVIPTTKEESLSQSPNDGHRSLVGASLARDDNEGTLPEKNEHNCYNQIFLKILSHENVASREPIYEKYDKQVQGITIIEPGEADAGVMQPFKDEKYPAEIRNTGIALKVDQNPRYCQIDPYWGGVNAVVESMRNVAAVGATPWAITDCLNFGNPEKPEQMWEFVEGTRGVAEACKGIHLKYDANPRTDANIANTSHLPYSHISADSHHSIPIISGNVSLYNEAKGKPIAPSPIIACLGKLADVNKAITMHFKKTNSILFLIGERKDECGGSVYYQLFNELGANVPQPNLPEVEQQIFALTDAIDAGLILAAHDISDGGLATTLAEMSFKPEIGCDVNIPGDLRADKKLFGETGGFVIEIEVKNLEPLRQTFAKRNVELIQIGKTTNEKKIKINECIDVDLMEAKKMWANGLRNKL